MMGSTVYVGGLPYSTGDAELSELFSAHGTVESVRIVTDRMTGRSRGFGFVEMSSAEEAEAAIAALNGSVLEGRTLTVNQAKPRESKPRQDSGRGRFGRTRPGRNRW
ncbi:MAG: RNA-binding protein [Candidatus Binatia bacterium]|nr:MAG: RNA-binding protein [Candidatus Binatia bacterium]